MSGKRYNIKELVHDPSFIRWVRGDAALEEKRFWDQWIRENPMNRELAMRAQEEIEGFILKPLVHSFSREWYEIDQAIKKKQGGQRSSSHQFSFTRSSSNDMTLKWSFRIAAGVLLIFISTYIIAEFYVAPTEGAASFETEAIVTEAGERKKARLSDGSELMINGNSELTYTIDRNDPNHIDLFLDGEAYFSIAERETGESPFQIRTKEGVVKILGTQLGVSTRFERTQVALEKGSVSVQPFHLDEEKILKPGQFVKFSRSSDSFEARDADLKVYTSWRNGQLYFDESPMHEVADHLEALFGVKIVIRNADLREQMVSGAIEDSDLNVITSALSKMLKISIKQSESDDVVYVGESRG